MNIYEFHEYILKDVDGGFNGASDYYEDKTFFHEQNYVVPFFRFTNILTE
jgi:hypothetical protein